MSESKSITKLAVIMAEYIGSKIRFVRSEIKLNS